jgi:hypothetical protein
MKTQNNEQQQKDFVKWCEMNNLEPKKYENLKRYLKEASVWKKQRNSTQTRLEA